MQKISPCLWFDTQAEEAVQHYLSIFKNSKITGVTRYGEGGFLPAGSVMTITFQLDGQDFMALNGGPHFAFSPAISFFVNCETQEEIDSLWAKLLEGGQEEQCGWLKDKYGVSWQIVPVELSGMLNDADAEKVQRVTQALLQMVKLDMHALRKAYEGQE